ncbi:DUF4177 domain-containing protein [Shimia sp. SDUM112013]|uniref:DUF4177 domain-containing protein n=1 Tax=Shimia sp. SDUM112013 TaxID=3136160 RepID=UPI0032EECF8D
MTTRYDYKVIPAPSKGKKARGVKGPEGRFAHALEVAMNDMAAEGWEYLRAETLPNEERVGLTGSQTSFRTVLVFRRPNLEDISAFEPRLLEAPDQIAANASAEDPVVAADSPSESEPEQDAPTPDKVDAAFEDATPNAKESEDEAAPLVLTSKAPTGDGAVPEDKTDHGPASALPFALRERAQKVGRPSDPDDATTPDGDQSDKPAP